jgi:hypothetical protein
MNYEWLSWGFEILDGLILLEWGIRHFTESPETISSNRAHRNDGLRLGGLAFCAVFGFVAGQKSLAIERERFTKFNLITQLSEEASAGSKQQFLKLKELATEDSEFGERAKARLRYVSEDLAFYDQSPTLAPKVELVTHIYGGSKTISEFPTEYLVGTLSSNVSPYIRLNVMGELLKKPRNEVDAELLKLFQQSDNLKALAAATGVLRRMHDNEYLMLDFEKWEQFLRKRAR